MHWISPLRNVINLEISYFPFVSLNSDFDLSRILLIWSLLTGKVSTLNRSPSFSTVSTTSSDSFQDVDIVVSKKPAVAICNQYEQWDLQW